MADDPKLVVALSARIDQFEKQMREAGLIAEREVRGIETKLSTVTFGTAGGVLLAQAIKAAMEAVKAEIERTIDLMLSLGSAAKKTAVDLEGLQRIGFTTRQAGISDKDMFSGLDNAARRMNEMNHSTTQLSLLLENNNIKYRDQAGHVVNIDRGLELAAELMGRARTEQDKIKIAEMFGLTRQWVGVLGEGVEKFRQMKAEAPTEDLRRAVAHMRALEQLASDVKAHFGNWGTSLVIHVLPLLEKVTAIIAAITLGLSQVAVGGPLEGFATELANRWAVVNGLVKSYLAQVDAAAKPRITVTAKPGVDFSGAGAGGFKDALDRANEALSKTIALTKAEFDTIGLTVAEQEKLKQETLLTEAAKRAGLNADTAVTAAMREQAALAGTLKQQLVERQHAFQEMVSSSKELGSALSDAFKGAVLEGKKFDEVLKSLTNRLASKAIDKIFDLMFAPAAGGGGSLLTQLLKGRQAGGPVTGGTPYMVGERGPELFVPNRSGMIKPNSAMRSGGGGAMTFAPVTNIDARGSSMGDAQFRAILAANNRAMLQTINQSAPARQRRLAMLGT